MTKISRGLHLSELLLSILTYLLFDKIITYLFLIGSSTTRSGIWLRLEGALRTIISLAVLKARLGIV